MESIRHIAIKIRRASTIIMTLFAVIVMIGCVSFKNTAYADDDSNNNNSNYTSDYMTGIDFYELAGGSTGESGTSSSSIATGGANIIKVIVNGVLLPASILVAAWKVIYIAIFPLMMRSDPLGMVSHAQLGDFRNMRYQRMASMMHSGTHRKADLDSPYDIVHQHLIPEVKKFGIAVGIIALVWIGLQFVMWGVVILLGFAH